MGAKASKQGSSELIGKERNNDNIKAKKITNN